MTERGRPSTWSDDRIDAAFAARFDPIHGPHGAVAATLDRLREPAVGGRWSKTRWRLGAVAAAVILVAGAIGLGSASLRTTDGQVGGIFRDGPDPNLRTLDVGSFAFEFPATWLAYEARATFSGGSSIAFLGTQAVEARCGDERHVDTNCVYEQRLEPGDVRVFVGTGGYRGGTILDRPDIENGTTERLIIAGRPAIRDTFDPAPASYYREDLAVHWAIAFPDTLTNVVRFELWAREDPSAGEPVTPATLQAMEAMLASLRFKSAAPMPGPSDVAPATALDLPVISVREALGIRDGGLDDRELAVRGWFPPIPPLRCRGSATSPTSPIEPVCSDEFTVLMQEPESLTTVSANDTHVRGPTGPSIHIDLDHLDRSWEPTLPDIGPATPVELVVVGHFDDRRSFACRPETVAACRDRFVVDRVETADGRTTMQRATDVAGRAITGSGKVVDTLIQAVPGTTVLSMVAVETQSVPGLAEVEPSIGVIVALEPYRAVWIVRTLAPGAERLSTYAVVDGSDVVYSIDDDGGATRIAGSLPTPRPTPAPALSPEVPGRYEVLLTDPADPGRPGPRVTVIDQASVLAAVRAVGPEDRAMGSGGDNVFARDPVFVDRYRLRWVGSICDQAITVTIHPGPTRIVVDHGTRDACDAMGVGRELVLDLTRSVDTTGVEVVVVPPTRAGASAFEVEFTSPLHAGLGGPRITVVDRSGRLRAAREVGADDGPFPGDRSTGNVYVANGAPNVLRVQWIGGLCDAGMAMTIDDGVTDSIAIESGVVEDCDSLGVTRELVLTFDGPIAAASMRARLSYP